MDLSPDARSKVVRTVMYWAFSCPGSGWPGWGQHSGLRLVHCDGLERPMTKSALAPRCFQAIFLVLAFDCLAPGRSRRVGLRDAGSAVAVRRRNGRGLGWWGKALSTPQPPEAVAAGQRLPSLV